MAQRMKINGTELMVDAIGPMTGEVVIFVHGYPLSRRIWAPQIEAIGSRCRTISYDLRGFGESASGERDFSMELFADDLLELLDALQIDKAIAVCISMGGYILLNAVDRHPERFRGLVLCDTRSGADSEEGRKKRLETIELITSHGNQFFAEDFLTKLFAPSSLTKCAKEVDVVRSMILNTSEETLLRAQRAIMLRKDMTASLSKISVPTIMIVGSEDLLTPPSDSEMMYRAIPGSQLRIIPEVGHMSNLENTEMFNRHFLEFLKLSGAGI